MWTEVTDLCSKVVGHFHFGYLTSNIKIRFKYMDSLLRAFLLFLEAGLS